MEIIPINQPLDIKKQEIEQVQKEQQEYHLIGSFLRTRGLKLYVYNEREDLLSEIKPESKQTISTNIDPLTGKLIVSDKESKEKCLIDSRNIPFEALNFKNAEKRVFKYKNREIKQLCNLIKL